MRKIFCIGIFSCILLSGCGSELKKTSSLVKSSSSKAWPYLIPCRIQDGSNPELLVTTLGDVQTSLSQGIFDPVKDEVRLHDGTIHDHYYRDILKIKNYQPLDKSHFPLPPSGWCTWYFYYSRITQDEVKRNARWIAENLKPYGAQYVQIDDGWQGSAAKQGQRDWSVVRPSQFPDGMAQLAGYIKSLGLTPGIWIAPHGQSNPQVVQDNPNVFLLKPDGTSASETWEGKFLVDPTTPESHKYLKELFQKMCDWGYEYFKIDGQPIVVEEYGLKKQYMRNPDDDNVKLYRQTLETMRSVIGKDRYLLGCWGMPVEGIGIMDGSRTAGDIVLGWEGGFMLALRAAQRDYYLHNIAWYCDPDVFVLRSPLTFSQAQAWATLQGLTGVALMGTDRLEDLSAPRVELLRRIYPAVDIRPLDLFQVERNKTLIDLKINHLGRQYDVLGLFNYSQEKCNAQYIQWADLGLPAETPIHVFDFWNQDYLGAWEAGMVVNIEPTSCRVLTLLPDSGKIQLISTNRHITQGWVDLQKVMFDDAAGIYSGTSRVIENDPYQLRFVFPKGKNYSIKSVSATGGAAVSLTNHQGWAVIQINSKKTQNVSWKATFEPAEFYPYPTSNPEHLRVRQVDSNTVNLTWQEQYWLNNGYRVYLNGKLLGYTPQASFPIAGLNPNEKYIAEVETTWEDATVSQKKSKLEFTLESGGQ